MSEFVGGPISEDVLKQIKLRETIFAQESVENSLKYIQFKTGNNAWIRVISGVDVDVKEDSTFSSKPAQDYVLSGGALFWDGTKFLKRDAFKTSDDSTVRGRYSFTKTFGIRPEGGITGFTIRHKNRFGTVREANINFTVWSKEDLQTAEELYFRPGMSVITEWGNTSYFNNDGNYTDIVNTKGTQDFFSSDRVVKQAKILKILQENIDSSNYNYDAFFGFVSNFSWSLREDGGFDCNITVLSRGAILDSLSVIKGNARLNGPFSTIEEKFFSIEKPPKPETPDTAVDDPGLIDQLVSGVNSVIQGADDILQYLNNGITYADTELEETQRLSLLHFFCLKVEEVDIENLDTGYITFENFKSPVYEVVEGQSTGNQEVEWSTVNGRKSKKVETNPITKLLEEEFKRQEVFFDPSIMIAAGFNGKVTGEGRTAFRYISIKTFLALVNLAFLNGKDQSIPKFNLTSSKQYETFDNHFSFDPSSVILPKSPTQPELRASKKLIKQISEVEEDTSVGGDQKDAYTKVILNNTSINIEAEGVNNPEHINNIYISTRLIKEQLDFLFTKNTSELDTLSVTTLVKNILNEVQNSLGGINEFDIHYDEIIDKLVIVDRAKILNDTVTNDKIGLLNISGLPNTVKSVNMETKIASNLASMISISATSGTEGDPNNNPGLAEYNKFKRDRFKNNFNPIKANNQDGNSNKPLTVAEQIEKDKAEKEAEADRQEKREKFFMNLFQAYSKFNNTKSFDLRNKGVYNERKFNKLKGEKISRTKEALAVEHKINKEAPANIIPIELSITLNGISGLVVGQVFRIESTFLPKIYKDTGFIITALDATIENNKWFTTVRAQTFMLNRREPSIDSSSVKNPPSGKY